MVAAQTKQQASMKKFVLPGRTPKKTLLSKNPDECDTVLPTYSEFITAQTNYASGE